MPIYYCMVGLLRRETTSSNCEEMTSEEERLLLINSSVDGGSSSFSSKSSSGRLHSCTIIGEHYIPPNSTNPYTTSNELRKTCLLIGEKLSWQNQRITMMDNTRSKLKFNCQIIDNLLFIACTEEKIFRFGFHILYLRN